MTQSVGTIIKGKAITYGLERKGKAVRGPLVFLNGWGQHPRLYEQFTQELADRGFEVISPALIGINSQNGPTPTTVREYAEWVSDFSEALQIGPHHLAGHSVGATVALETASNSGSPLEITALNPMLPIDFSAPGYIARRLKIAAKESVGNISPSPDARKRARRHSLKMAIPYITNLLKAPAHSLRQVREFTNYSLDDLRVEQPTLVVHAQEDEYYGKTREELVAELSPHFAEDASKLVTLSHANHDWPIFHPEQAARETSIFINEHR